MSLSFSDYVLAAMILLLLAGKVCKLAGWTKGALIADELEAALQKSRDLIAAIRGGGSTLNVENASEKVASQLSGVSAADVKPLVESLVESAVANKYGVSVTLDSSGNVKVDTTNLATKFVRKAGKWLKKVF